MRHPMVVLTAGLMALLAVSVAVVAQSLEPGDCVTFMIPAAGSQPEPNSQDMIVYSDGAATVIDATGCLAVALPLQAAVLVDAGTGGSRPIRIVTRSPDPVPPGTRLSGIVRQGSCQIDGVDHRKYEGTVEAGPSGR